MKPKIEINKPVYISKRDAERFNWPDFNRNDKMIVLAFLCYMKAFGGRKNIIDIPLIKMINWTGIMPDEFSDSLSHIAKKRIMWCRGLDEDEFYDRYGLCEFMFLLPYKNVGEYELVKNNLDILYRQLFPEEFEDEDED